MRWFKHLAMAHEDEGLCSVVEEMGVMGSQAYGIYWFILEAVAAPMERDSTTPELSHSDLKWASICHTSVRVFRRIADRLAVENLIQVQISTKSTGNWTKISVPKLLKYRDEYNRKSGHSPDNVRPRSDQSRSDTDTDQIKQTHTAADAAPCVPVPEPKPKRAPKEPTEYDRAISEVAGSVKERHPKDDGRSDIGVDAVVKKLRAIGNKLPVIEQIREMREIDRRHAGWCEHWKRAGFAKALSNWLAPTEGKWAAEPPTDSGLLPFARMSSGQVSEERRKQHLAAKIGGMIADAKANNA